MSLITLLLSLSFPSLSTYCVHCYAPKYQSKFLACESLLGNNIDSDSDSLLAGFCAAVNVHTNVVSCNQNTWKWQKQAAVENEIGLSGGTRDWNVGALVHCFSADWNISATGGKMSTCAHWCIFYLNNRLTDCSGIWNRHSCLPQTEFV